MYIGLNNLGLNGGANGLDPDAVALIARMAPAPSASRQRQISRFIGRLKATGVWDKLDALHVHAAADAQSARLNWKDATKTLSENGSLTFTVDRGYVGDGTTGYLTGWGGPTTYVQYTQDSAFYGVHVAKAGNQTGHCGISGAASNLQLNAGPLIIVSRVNSTANKSWSVNNSVGLSVVVRPDSANVIGYKDGALINSQADVSVALSATARTLGRNNASFSSDTIAMQMVGGALTAGQVADLNAACNEYLAALGWFPIPSSETSTLALQTATTLPDATGGAPAGVGFVGTGLARASDGTWWVGNHLGKSVVRLSADRLTVLAEYTLGVGTLATISATNKSVQGVCMDTTDDTIYFMVKDTVTAGNSVVAHIQASGTLIGTPFAAAAGNGLAYDSIRDKIIWSTLTVAQWVDKSTGVQDGLSLSLPGTADQLAFDAVGNRLLYTADTGAELRVMSLSNDYGAPIEVKAITLTGADAPEGAVVHGGILYVTNDANFHGGTPALNRVLTYDASAI